jgi:hypothetical protein
MRRTATHRNRRPLIKKRGGRRAGSTPVTKLIRDLKEEKFFAEAKTPDAIQAKLKEKGFTILPGPLAARLVEITRKGDLHRQDTGDGFIYKDSPFDANGRVTPPVG